VQYMLVGTMDGIMAASVPQDLRHLFRISRDIGDVGEHVSGHVTCKAPRVASGVCSWSRALANSRILLSSTYAFGSVLKLYRRA
jgi:hypothetical protein